MGEINEKLSGCLQDEPAFCTVACPFHLDIKDFIEKMQRSSFSAAFKVYRNAVGFPKIVAELCHEPCRAVCPRKDIDEAVAIRLLERASIDYTKSINPTDYNVPEKNRKIAVIGAGISGLACALRLVSKKYEVTLYEQSNRIGGHLWEILPSEMFLGDIENQFMYEKYTLNLNTWIERIDDLSCDAIYVATGSGGSDFGLLKGMTEHSFASGREGVFLGGSLLGAGSAEAIAHGLYAANQIENYIKTGNMGSYIEAPTTKIQLNTKTLVSMNPIRPEKDNSFNREEAKAEADRCLRCSCDECRKKCDLIQHYRKNPKQIGDEVRATTGPEGVRGDITVATKLISSCDQCGLCRDTCPEDIDMGRMLLEGRRALHRKGSLPWAYHDFFLRDMVAANHESAHLASIPKGYTKSGYAFFPGCQLGASDPEYVSRAYRCLREHKPDTGLILGCCGAPVVWAGDETLQKETFEKIGEEWSALGKPLLIFACATCRKMFHDYLPEIDGAFLYDILLQWEVKPLRNMEGQKYSIFDPCASRDEPMLQKAVRELSGKAGCILEPLPYEGSLAQCCSYGGQISVANPEYVKKVVRKRIGQNNNPFITYCTNCRDIFAAEGKPVIHILDLMFDLNDNWRIPPTITDRRKNRIELKRNILMEFWNEEKSMEQTGSKISLTIAPGMKAKLNKELILENDVTAVVEYCESSRNKLVDLETGSFFGYLQIGHFTYWVEYRSIGESFELINAYCHRMEIVPGGV